MSLASDHQIYYQIQIIRCHRQSRLVYTNVIYIALSYRRTPRIKITYTNYFISSLNIYASKTLISNSSTLSSHSSTDGKPYYNSSLFLNKSIDLTSISL